MNNYSIDKLKKNFDKNNSEFINLKCKTIYKLNKNIFFGLDWTYELNIFDFIDNEESELVFCLHFLNVKEYKEGLDNFENELIKFLALYRVYLDEKKRKYPVEVLQKKQVTTKENKYPEDKYWFVVGLKLATGELQQIYKNTNRNATQTAIKLGNKHLRPYISESISNTNKNDKNIFRRSKNNIDLIMDYCKENRLKVCDDFKNKLPNQHE